MVFIYVLKEPDTGVVRYVGKSTNPKRRFRTHINTSGKKRNHKECWISSLLDKGLKPIMEVIDEVPEEHGKQWEVAWIAFFKESECDLVNGTLGGDGSNPSVETRKKMRQAKLGKPGPWLGKKRYPETVEKMRAGNRGKPNCWKGKTRPPETNEKISQTMKGVKPSLARKEKTTRAQNIGHARRRWNALFWNFYD